MVPKESCFDVIGGRVRCSVRSITEKGLYKWRVLIRGEVAQCVNCYMRVVPTGKMALANTVMTDLSQNFPHNQHFGLGKFNVFPKTHFIYFKYFFKDDYENLYIHEDLPSLETVWPVLSNASMNLNLTWTRIANTKALNALIFKTTVVQTQASINSFALTREGQYSVRLFTNTLGSNSYPVYIRDNRTSPGYAAPRGSTISLKLREKTYSQRAGQSTSIQFGLYVNDFSFLYIDSKSTDLSNVQFTNPLPALIGALLNGNQIVAQYRGQYEKF